MRGFFLALKPYTCEYTLWPSSTLTHERMFFSPSSLQEPLVTMILPQCILLRERSRIFIQWHSPHLRAIEVEHLWPNDLRLRVTTHTDAMVAQQNWRQA